MLSTQVPNTIQELNMLDMAWSRAGSDTGRVWGTGLGSQLSSHRTRRSLTRTLVRGSVSRHISPSYTILQMKARTHSFQMLTALKCSKGFPIRETILKLVLGGRRNSSMG